MQDDDQFFPAETLIAFGERVLGAMGCSPEIASEVSMHLVDADLAGVYSHGIFRLTQYAEQARDGRYDPAMVPTVTEADGGGVLVDGNRGFGIPAMRLAMDVATRKARDIGTSAVGIRNVGHTGRIGAFAETAADDGCLAIILGGGARRDWPQVAPFGGAKGMLPTNPYSFGIPGGEQGPVVLDFATAAGAGGKVYAAKSAGRPLPAGLCIDATGNPTTNPDDYFNGGALLPMAGPKGYGMALVGELLGEAVFGEAMDGLNWVCIAVDLSRFGSASRYSQAAESCLADLRSCPPAPGFSRVEIPGERERRIRQERLDSGVPLPPETVRELNETAKGLGVARLT